MPTIEIETRISAPIERVFDLARSIDLHVKTAGRTGERAIGGIRSGLIGLGDEVTWSARHFGFRQNLTVRVTEMERPKLFVDIMTRGAFRSMTHEHRFEQDQGGTLMRDRFEFEAPFGPLGRLACRLFLSQYMRRFLVNRNAILKSVAEGEEWGRFLGKEGP
jgi:ligand-binding SRPBCC domain-containing protein